MIGPLMMGAKEDHDGATYLLGDDAGRHLACLSLGRYAAEPIQWAARFYGEVLTALNTEEP